MTEKILRDEVTLNVEQLHSLIRYWRKKKEEAFTDEDELVAAYYVDAFQTVLVIHGLPLYPKHGYIVKKGHDEEEN